MQKAANTPSQQPAALRALAVITLLVTLSVVLPALTACASSASGTTVTAANATTTKAAGNTTTTSKTSSAVTTATTTKQSTKATDAAITIKDPELEKVIRKQLGKADGNLTATDMMDLISLRVDAKVIPVKDLDGL